MRPDKTDSTNTTDIADIDKKKNDGVTTHPNKESWSKEQWKDWICQGTLGERILPMEFVQRFYTKPGDMSWEKFLDIMNAKFKVTQQNEIDKINQRNREREEARQKQIEYEAEQAKIKQQQEEKRKADEREKEKIRLQKLKEDQDKKEEENRKKIEEAQRKAELLRQQKADQVQKEAEEMAAIAAKDLFDFDDFNEDKTDTPTPPKPVKVKTEKGTTNGGATTDLGEHVQKIYDKNEATYRVAVQNYDLNKQIEKYLNEVGSLIVHPDVVYALQNLKTLGQIMKKQNQTKDPSLENQTRPDASRNLFPETVADDTETQEDKIQRVAMEIKQENGSISTVPLGRSPSSLVSPPAAERKMFPGMKRHTPQSFSEVVATKRRKTGNTPARQGVLSPVTSPHRPINSVEEAKSKADAMCKSADLGATFIKNKKITANNVPLIYDSVSQHGREIVEYHEEVQSFYRIMTHYVPTLGMIPEDQRYLELKRNLFEFVMKNTEYTKVSSNLFAWLLFIYFFCYKSGVNFYFLSLKIFLLQISSSGQHQRYRNRTRASDLGLTICRKTLLNPTAWQ